MVAGPLLEVAASRFGVEGRSVTTVHAPSPCACQQAATHEVSERSERGVACWLAQGLGA